MNSRDHAFEGARPGVHGDTAVPRESTLVGDSTASVTSPTGSDIDHDAVSGRLASGEHPRAGDGHNDRRR